MSGPTKHVFISHGKADAWVAKQIARCVRDCGATTFLDEDDIPKGDDFKARIREETNRCDELIALFTPWSVERNWVWVEVGAAFNRGIPIVGVLYQVTLTEIEEQRGGSTIFTDRICVDINQFEGFLNELRQRIQGAANG